MSTDLVFVKPITYKVITPIFEGPLDLLLHLIEKAELDITALSLAEITDQYLEIIHNLKDHASEEISSFLVIAAKLLLIKSFALLPKPSINIDGDEDVGDQLVRQLTEYKRLKNAANQLEFRENQGTITYLRLNSPLNIEPVIDLSDLSIFDLLQAASRVFAEKEQDTILITSIGQKRISMRQKIQFIANKFLSEKQVGFWILVDQNPSRVEIVVTFLAILELIKQDLIKVYQNSIFDEIHIEAMENWDLKTDFDLEFGE
jgi:segregation and condensation protein A